MNWFKKTSGSEKFTKSGGRGAYSHLLRVSDDEGSENGQDITPEVSTTKRRLVNRVLELLTKGVFILFAVWGLVNLSMITVSTLRPPVKPVSCSCGGTTVAEAISRGCKFTPLAIAWLPPQCLDEELADEFDQIAPNGGWEYWADLNGTIPMTREEVGLLADTESAVFYTTQEWHVMHCMYTWRKHYRSQFNGVTIERRSNGIDHIHHCEEIVRDRAPLLKIWTMAGIELNADLA
jgi:hypothetical protein